MTAAVPIAPTPPAPATTRLLHVLTGDCTRELLEAAGVPGTMAVWADVLHDGPVPASIADDAWRPARARFIAATGWATYEDALATYARWDAGLAAHAAHDETVLWCEHDLFDQLLLARHLAWFAEHAPRARLSLICVGAWPGRPHFKGLGELAPAELAPLLDTREPVTAAQRALGVRAWRAFTAPDPRAIERLLDDDTSALPFLAPALRRHLEELPSTRDGLARTDRTLLELIAAGTTRLGDLFPALHRTERWFFIADSSFHARLRALAAAPHALVTLDEGGGRWSETGTAALTALGRRVLAGEVDHVALAGIDAWRGGVHLTGTAPAWRWDVEAGRVVGSA